MLTIKAYLFCGIQLMTIKIRFVAIQPLCEEIEMKTLATTTAVAEDPPTELIESETDKVAGGAPPVDVGNHWGAGEGLGFDGRGGGQGQGASRNNPLHGRF
jgi:hypothetical protein